MSNAEALTKSLLEVLGLEETFGNTPQMTITLILLAVAASVAGDHAGALGWLGKAIVRARDIGYWVGAVMVVTALAIEVAVLGQWRDAARLHGALAARLPTLRVR